MKKTLAAVAILGAFAASASADVTVYGKVDLGLMYTNVDGAEKIAMESGAGGNTSRIGFKGSEKIGDMTVGFCYETGLSADDGTASKTFNNRDSHVFVKGAYGELGLGYYGVLDASTGPYSITGNASAAGTGWGGDILDQGWVIKTKGRMTNAVTYVSPAFAGAKVYAQVASGSDKTSGEYTDDADFYYGVGVDYKAGGFGAFVTVSSTEYGKNGKDADGVALETNGLEDLNVVAGVNYDFGVVKAYLGANYYESGVKGEDQYGVVASVKGALAGGTAYASAGYGEITKNATSVGEEKRFYVGAGYQYPLSKATFLYGAVNYRQADATDVVTKGEAGAKTNTSEVAFGIVHNF